MEDWDRVILYLLVAGLAGLSVLHSRMMEAQQDLIAQHDGAIAEQGRAIEFVRSAVQLIDAGRAE